jgi:hypothetical protein
MPQRINSIQPTNPATNPNVQTTAAEAADTQAFREFVGKNLQVGTDISDLHRSKLIDLMVEFRDVIAANPKKPSRTTNVSHQIDTQGYAPIKSQPYRTSPKENEIIMKEVEEMISNDIIEPSDAPWSFPVVLIKKPDGSIRFCVDYRKLNAVTKSDAYPLPLISEALDYVGKAQFFTTLDLASGYWQVPMHPDDKDKTTFTTRFGTFRFKVLPFGLKNAPATFQRLMDKILGKLKW